MISIELYCLTRRSGTLVCVPERHTLHVGTLLPSGMQLNGVRAAVQILCVGKCRDFRQIYGCHFGFCLQRLIPGAPASCPLRSPRNWWAGFRRHPAVRVQASAGKSQKAVTRRNCDMSSRPAFRSSRQLTSQVSPVLARIPYVSSRCSGVRARLSWPANLSFPVVQKLWALTAIWTR
jgi:hypothetical protein